MRVLFALILVGSILFFTGCFSGNQAESGLGVVRALSGEVFYHPADLDSRIRLQESDVNRVLFHLDKLVVGKDSHLHVYLGDAGDLFIEPESTVIVQRPDQKSRFKTFARLVQGVLSCFVEKQNSNFAIQTPVTVAGVLGTSFQIQVQGDQTDITLAESKVGIELQSLRQDLQNAPVLKTLALPGGAMAGRRVSLREPVTDKNASELEATFMPVEALHNLTYLAGYAGGNPVRKSLLDYNVRTTTIQR